MSSGGTPTPSPVRHGTSSYRVTPAPGGFAILSSVLVFLGRHVDVPTALPCCLLCVVLDFVSRANLECRMVGSSSWLENTA